MNSRGVTLIELIIVIIVGGIFIPLAYIAFTSVLSDSARPERAATIKAIAEAKMTDIVSGGFDSFASVNLSYRDVRGDATNTNGRFSEPAYIGYRWRWEIDLVLPNNCNVSPSCTAIYTAATWQNNYKYKPGDYVTPTDYLTPDHHYAYRVYYPLWVADRRYRVSEIDGVSDMVRPVIANGYYYKAVLPPERKNTYRYNLGDMIIPSKASPVRIFKNVEHDPWKSGKQYLMNSLITVLSGKRNYKVVGCDPDCSCTSSLPEPVWSDTDNAVVTEGCRTWQEFTFSGVSPPAVWTDPTIDGGIKWQEDNTLKSKNSGSGPSGATFPIYDGSVTWEPHAKSTLQSASSAPAWQTDLNINQWEQNHVYFVGNTVRPTYTSSRVYMCIAAHTSGTAQPTWPSKDAGIFPDSSEPVLWQEKSCITDNNVSWIRSSAYKRITVYVAPPNCNNDSCASIFSSIIATRDYVSRP